MVPTSLAAEALRQPPKEAGERSKHCFLTGNSTELREMLVPVETISLFDSSDASSDVDMGFDLFDKQCTNNDTGRSCRDDGCASA